MHVILQHMVLLASLHKVVDMNSHHLENLVAHYLTRLNGDMAEDFLQFLDDVIRHKCD